MAIANVKYTTGSRNFRHVALGLVVASSSSFFEYSFAVCVDVLAEVSEVNRDIILPKD